MWIKKFSKSSEPANEIWKKVENWFKTSKVKNLNKVVINQKNQIKSKKNK